MSKTVFVELTPAQIDLLRGVLFEYYAENEVFDSTEETVRQELEIVLADAENEACFA